MGPEQISRDSTTMGPEQISRHSTTMGPEQISRHSTTMGPERISQHSTPMGPVQISRDSTTMGPEQISQDSTTMGPERISRHSTPMGPVQISRDSTTMGPQQWVPSKYLETPQQWVLSKYPKTQQPWVPSEYLDTPHQWVPYKYLETPQPWPWLLPLVVGMDFLVPMLIILNVDSSPALMAFETELGATHTEHRLTSQQVEGGRDGGLKMLSKTGYCICNTGLWGLTGQHSWYLEDSVEICHQGNDVIQERKDEPRQEGPLGSPWSVAHGPVSHPPHVTRSSYTVQATVGGSSLHISPNEEPQHNINGLGHAGQVRATRCVTYKSSRTPKSRLSSTFRGIDVEGRCPGEKENICFYCVGTAMGTLDQIPDCAIFACYSVSMASICMSFCLHGQSLHVLMSPWPVFACPFVSMASLCMSFCLHGQSLHVLLSAWPVSTCHSVTMASLCMSSVSMASLCISSVYMTSLCMSSVYMASLCMSFCLHGQPLHVFFLHGQPLHVLLSQWSVSGCPFVSMVSLLVSFCLHGQSLGVLLSPWSVSGCTSVSITSLCMSCHHGQSLGVLLSPWPVSGCTSVSMVSLLVSFCHHVTGCTSVSMASLCMSCHHGQSLGVLLSPWSVSACPVTMVSLWVYFCLHGQSLHVLSPWSVTGLFSHGLGQNRCLNSNSSFIYWNHEDSFVALRLESHGSPGQKQLNTPGLQGAVTAVVTTAVHAVQARVPGPVADRAGSRSMRGGRVTRVNPHPDSQAPTRVRRLVLTSFICKKQVSHATLVGGSLIRRLMKHITIAEAELSSLLYAGLIFKPVPLLDSIILIKGRNGPMQCVGKMNCQKVCLEKLSLASKT
ncbi:hypothetical protein MAR_027189 [Mya arenaria]|uniref:Uncharacterized protein n=1 Tax=Mya arenaria TaxID=6604 RepID=A0ABY7EX54_MYAAR|nr:hypothetical protein MAR_027189 [Mya arenaria]